MEIGWVNSFSMTAVATIKGESTKWMVTGVYGLMDGGQVFDDFINELEVIRGRREIPWCVGGDFNEVLFLNEGIGLQGGLGGWTSSRIL